VLAPFTALGSYPGNVQEVVRWFAVAYLAIAAIAAWYLGGALAAVLTSALLAISPFARISGTLVLSDLFAVIPLLVVLMLLKRVSTWRVLACGLLAGLLVPVRLNMLMVLPALALAMPTRYWKPLALGSLPGLAALALFFWLAFGSPLKTTYGAPGTTFATFEVGYATAAAPRLGEGGVWLFPDRLNGKLMHWVCPCPPSGPQGALPNIWFYPVALSGIFWIITPPFITLIGLVYAWRHRGQPAARFTLFFTALLTGLHIFYYGQEARYLAAPATMLGIYGAIAIAYAIRHPPLAWPAPAALSEQSDAQPEVSPVSG
jgi:hypothetical protein